MQLGIVGSEEVAQWWRSGGTEVVHYHKGTKVIDRIMINWAAAQLIHLRTSQTLVDCILHLLKYVVQGSWGKGTTGRT